MFHRKMLYIYENSDGVMYRVAFLPLTGKVKLSAIRNGRTFWRETNDISDPDSRDLFHSIFSYEDALKKPG